MFEKSLYQKIFNKSDIWIKGPLLTDRDYLKNAVSEHLIS